MSTLSVTTGPNIYGYDVWLALGVLSVGWLVLTLTAGRGQGIGPVGLGRWITASWFSRVGALAAWAVAGWHLFCQRP